MLAAVRQSMSIFVVLCGQEGAHSLLAAQQAGLAIDGRLTWERPGESVWWGGEVSVGTGVCVGAGVYVDESSDAVKEGG